VDNIMWESDYPHITSTYPNSRTSAARLVDGLPEEDRRKLLYENTLRLYELKADS
jgi:predicted TIM-barrel fold metal-dependent hydrolase